MILDLQFKIKSNPNFQRYIRENSNWYKNLNRDPSTFKMFQDELKERYQLRPTDKINSFVEKLDMIRNLMDIIK